MRGQEYYRNGKAFVHVTCIVDEAFASSADIPKSKFQRGGTDTECYLTDEERYYLEKVFNGYLELGYKPFDAAHRAFTPIVYSRLFPVSSGTWFKVQLDLLAEKQQRNTK
ncbi:hypothetical protein [Canibacter oris]|uniref:Uncharacterized protein n=1 Tax=Canibacter oris TaxID=1365628 RepID=A0A840DGA5_9MICO|nr:hypothetical protein [Canibacter oris]MBB4072074.1 hypothetical protein [Canibacter oris]